MDNHMAKAIRIGINALHIKWGVNAGTETYFTNIVKPWYEDKIDDCNFILYCNALPPWWTGAKENFDVEIYPLAGNIFYRMFVEQVIFPRRLFRKIDVLFNPGYVGSIFLKSPQIVTIHDSFAWRYPSEIGWFRSIYWRTVIPFAAKKSIKIIAVSENTASDVAKYCHISKNKIIVIYEGGRHLNNLTHKADFLEKFDFETKSYFHCIGFFKDIKNPIRILNAYKIYRKKNPTSAKKLVLAGLVSGKKAKSILQYAESIEGVYFIGRISDDELIQLYQNSSGLIFTSLYEGFGIPILEAQSFACPIITSNVSSMPEIAGDGAILVDPLDTNNISEAISNLSEMDSVELIKKGNHNLSRFSWEKASQYTLELLIDTGRKI